MMKSRCGMTLAGCLAVALTTLVAPRTSGADEWSCILSDLALRPPIDRKPFDILTGRDTLNYPPDPTVRYEHLRLELTFPNLRDRRFVGRETLTIRGITPDTTCLRLNAVELHIARITDGAGRPLEFLYDDRVLTILFPDPLPTDRSTRLHIDYECRQPRRGLYFTLPDIAHPARRPQVYSQGQTEDNRFWFPCHDYPNVRCSTEMIVTVPAPLLAVSNGRLVETRTSPDGQFITYHWLQQRPHVAYLVTLVIGEFDVVRDRWGDIPVEYYVPPGTAEDARATFQRTPDMIEFFSRRLGVEYPWDKYAQLVVENFVSGGMENTSATTLLESAVLDERARLDNDMDGLIAHELGHQWYGDLLTCKSWAHIWLNEGFATYMRDLWFEHWKGRERYDADIWHRIRAVAAADSVTDPTTLVFRDYRHSWNTFRHKGSLPYSKGSLVLHMLRHRLGDDLFFRALGEYTRRFAGRAVETDDLRRVFDEVTGRSWEPFFQQWAYRPGVPQLDIHYRWDDRRNEAVITVRQTQPITRDTPAFTFPLDVFFRAPDGDLTVTIDVDEQIETYRHPFTRPPRIVAFDPHVGLLARLTIDKPPAMWLAQLAEGPTIGARLNAIEALARIDRPHVVDALAAVLTDEQAYWQLRTDAADALARIHSPRARDHLVGVLAGGGPAEPRVRAACINALARFQRPDTLVDVILPFARHDPSYNVEAAAIRALGRLGARGLFGFLLRKLDTPSWSDTIRRAAIAALADLNDPRALEPLARVSTYGYPWRTRPEAVAALARLGRNLPDLRPRIRAHLEYLMYDPEDFTQRAAVQALGTLDDPQAIPALEAFAESGQDEWNRRWAARVLEGLRERLEPPQALRDLRDRLRRLEERNHELRQRLADLEKTLAPTTAPATQSAAPTTAAATTTATAPAPSPATSHTPATQPAATTDTPPAPARTAPSPGQPDSETQPRRAPDDSPNDAPDGSPQSPAPMSSVNARSTSSASLASCSRTRSTTASTASRRVSACFADAPTALRSASITRANSPVISTCV